MHGYVLYMSDEAALVVTDLAFMSVQRMVGGCEQAVCPLTKQQQISLLHEMLANYHCKWHLPARQMQHGRHMCGHIITGHQEAILRGTQRNPEYCQNYISVTVAVTWFRT